MSETWSPPPLPHYLLILRRLVTAPSESPEDRFPRALPARRILAASASGFAEIRGYPVSSSEPRPCGTRSAIRVAAGCHHSQVLPTCTKSRDGGVTLLEVDPPQGRQGFTAGRPRRASGTDEWRSATYKALPAYDGNDRRDLVLARNSFCTRRQRHPNSPSLSD